MRTRGRLWALVIVLVVAALGVGAWITAPLVRDRPGNSVDYRQKVFDLVNESQASGEDCWGDYLRAVELHQKLEQEIRDEAPELEKLVHPEYWTIYKGPEKAPASTGDAEVDALNKENAAKEAADHAVAREWAIKALERFPGAGIDEALDAVVKGKRAVRPKGTGLIMLEDLPDLGGARGLARALRARVWLSAERGDEASVLTDVRRMLALARVTGTQGSLLERLVGNATIAMTTGVIRESMMRRSFSEASLQALLQSLEADAVLAPMTIAFEGERLRMLDYMQAIHTDDGHGDGVRLVTRAKEIADEKSGAAPGHYSPLLNLGGLTLPGKKEMVGKVNEMFDGLVKAAAAPRRERDAVFDMTKYAAAQGKKYEMVTLVLGAYGHTFASWDQIQMDVAGTRVMVGIEVYRARHGKPPARLADLVPEEMALLPTDPYAPDGEFRYEVLDAPDALGRTYLLYSVGADGEDNHGVSAPFRFDALRDSAGLRADFVINAAD